MQRKEFYSDNIRYLMYILIFIIGNFAWYQYTQDLDLKDTLYGFSPHEWLITKNLDINKLGYSSGLEIYFSSFFMYIYIFFFDVLHIDGLMAEKIVIFIEIFSKIISAYFIVEVLFKDEQTLKKDLIFFTFSLFCISGYTFYADLSRFGEHYFAGLFYNIADSTRLISIALFLNRKFLLSSIFLSISLLTHPLYALIGGIFIFSIIIFYFKNFTKKDYIKIFSGALIFVLILTCIYFNIQTNEYLRISEKIPSEVFINWSLFGNYHWYPIEFGLFGIYHYENFLGFITISLLFLYSLYSKSQLNLIDKQVFIGWLSMIFLTIVGIYFSWTKDSVFMIKLSLTRASLLALEISILYIVYRFVSDIIDKNQKLIIRSLSFVLLVSPFLIKVPFSYGISILLIIYYLIVNRKSITINIYFMGLLSLLTISIILLLYYYFLGYINWDYYVNYLGSIYLIKIFFISFIIFNIINFVKYIKFSHIILGVMICLSFLSYYWLDLRVLLKNDERNFAQDYKEVQLWANKHSEESSIFILDPSLGSGWRLYSQRASFGTFREWTHNAWLYKEDYSIYKKGIEKLNEFEINLNDKRYDISPKLRQFNNLNNDIEFKFYNFDNNWFDKIADKYGLNYIVKVKSKIIKDLNYKIIFENNSFIVYKIR
ncbi:hypothetical protein [Aliarcobacter butzleri]|uniref:hypothetical protein n=1 Tax=Aliarcobacter butzleri TaxID=28197 RepID=UPI002B24BFCE|nr:hypothetical protein [Aliarcobacter butzleri]